MSNFAKYLNIPDRLRNTIFTSVGYANPFENTTDDLYDHLDDIGIEPFFPEDRAKRIEEFNKRMYREEEEMIDPVSKELEFELQQRIVPVTNKLEEKGFNKNVMAGILGNIAVETGGSFDYQQKEYGDGNGYGLFQLDFQRPYYEKFLEKNDLEDSAQAQIDYMHETIYGDEQDVIGKGNAKKLRKVFENAKTPEEVTEAFMNIWEKPKAEVSHLDRRIASAQSFFNII
jgi:hypothetical protein